MPEENAVEDEQLVFMKPLKKNQSWTDVAVFEDFNAGKVIETFLMDKGLEARTYGDKFFRYFLFLRPPRVTFRVQVRHASAKAAEHLLDVVAPDALERAIHCPSCNSLHISYPQMTRKFILPTILLHLGILLRLIGHECYCEHCHCVWHLSGENTHTLAKPVKQFPFS
jgi:hypothetical protein